MTEERSLFSMGYRCMPTWTIIPDTDVEQVTIQITTPKGEQYIINAAKGECTCQGYFHRQHCRHLSGLLQLLIEQAGMYAEQRRLLPPVQITALQRELLHKGEKPSVVLNMNQYSYFMPIYLLEDAEWNLLAVAAILKGHDWCLPARFICPEEKSDE